MKCYVQVGAGAGDLDWSAGFRDGFSKFVKSIELLDSDKVLVVEANRLNIPTLSESWVDVSQVEIFNLAITAIETKSNDSVEIFWSPQDGPYFQISSINREHVESFYPKSEIRSFFVPSMSMNDFLRAHCEGFEIELLALDIEGLDLLVMQSLDLAHFRIHKISFEKSHGKNHLLQSVDQKLSSFGYRRAGSGMDPHNSDVLWVKPKGQFELLQIVFAHILHRFWEIQIPLRHRLKSIFFWLKTFFKF